MQTLLLSLETSSPVCSVALHRVADGALVGQSELRLDKSDSTHLTILLSSCSTTPATGWPTWLPWP